MPDRVPRLEVEGLAACRGGRTVLEDLSFRIDRGEAFGLLGPNGAGKTTAFRVLTGGLPAKSGVVRIDGATVSPGDGAARERLGIVFQEPALDLRLTARENLTLAARLYGVPRRTARERIDELLADAGLDRRGDEPVSRFSTGMRRRVEVARALVHEPDLLVLDEPTTGLDEAAFRRTWDHLLSLKRERGLTLLLTSHRPDEAELCDRLAILDGGRIVACDAPDRLRARVSGDVLILEADDPEGVAAALAEGLGVASRVLEGRVILERERGHEWVPRLVEAVPGGSLRSVSVRRVGMGEVFLELTGHVLSDEPARPNPVAGRNGGGS